MGTKKSCKQRREQGVKIAFGPGRHPTSSAMFHHFEGPDGMVYEYSSSYCLRGSRPDIPEFCDQEQSGAKAA